MSDISMETRRSRTVGILEDGMKRKKPGQVVGHGRGSLWPRMPGKARRLSLNPRVGGLSELIAANEERYSPQDVIRGFRRAFEDGIISVKKALRKRANWKPLTEKDILILKTHDDLAAEAKKEREAVVQRLAKAKREARRAADHSA